jgi:formate dehydrogenase gamma subunit
LSRLFSRSMYRSVAPCPVAVVSFIILACSPVCMSGQSIADDTCMMCHSRKGSSIPAVDPEPIGNSVHGKNRCISCHPDADAVPHPRELAPANCAKCHRKESEVYLNSRHGLVAKHGRTDAEACSDCHGNGHSILDTDNPDSPANRKNVPDTCARCHADTERMAAIRLAEKDSVNTYLSSVHGQAFKEGKTESAVCTDCHGTHDLYNSLNTKSRIFRENIPDTCGSCHKDIVKDYKESVHGQAALKGAVESPVCTDCHGGHAVRSSKESGISASTGAVTRVCSECHESERIIRKFGLPADRLKTYMGSYHGLAARRGDLSVANCASCHGYHNILPSDDPRSSINKKNLSETCRRCHPGAGDALSSGYVHDSPENRHWSVSLAQWFYWGLIAFSLCFMLFHNGLDWIHKARTRIRTTIYPDEIRFTVNERLQHGILVLLFILMALTGFALRHSGAVWAGYLVPFDEVLRRTLHRWAALVFILLSIYHFLYLLFTKRGRFIIKEMRPHWDDAGDMMAVIAYNMGIRKTPPIHKAFYRYPEKTEYCFLIWGVFVMVITGSILAFNNFTLRHFPLWVPELATTIHYYEAILACTAIAIWHLYMVAFDPDVYPMNCAWWSGRIRCSERKRLGGRRKYFKRIPYGRF